MTPNNIDQQNPNNLSELFPLPNESDVQPPFDLPNWLSLTGASEEFENTQESSIPSVPYWPNAIASAEHLEGTCKENVPSRENDTLRISSRWNDDLPLHKPTAEQSQITEKIALQTNTGDEKIELPFPPPFSAGLSKLSPFLSQSDSTSENERNENSPSLTRTPPPAEPLEISPASAIWRTRRITVTPQIDEKREVAIFRTVIRDDAGRGFENARVTFPLPQGIKQVQASRKPIAKKGLLNWELGSVGPTDSIPLSVKIPISLLGGMDSASAPRTFELIYQPLPGAKLVGELSSPSAIVPGDPFSISLRISNTGELPTQEITVRISDRSSGTKPITRKLNALAPGENQTVEIELVSQIQGRHDWTATVESPGSEPVESIFSTEGIRVALVLKLEHNSMIRVDQIEDISLIICNESPVLIRGITAQLTIPEELTYDSSESGNYDRSINLLSWTVGDLPANSSKTVVARLRGFAPGLVGFQARADAPSGKSVSATSNIFVEIDNRTTSSSLDKLLAVLEETVSEEDDDHLEQVVEVGSRHLVFDLDGAPYAVPITNIREVLRPNRMTTIPGGPRWLQGVANVRGDIVSIVDLQLFFGMNSSTDTSRGLLIAQSNDAQLTVGLLVTSIVGIRRLQPGRALDTDHFGSQAVIEYLDGIAEHDQRIIPILRLDQLVRATEERMMSL